MHKRIALSLLLGFVIQGTVVAQQFQPPPGFAPTPEGSAVPNDGGYTPDSGNYGAPPQGFNPGWNDGAPGGAGNQFPVPPPSGMNRSPQYGAPVGSAYDGYPAPLIPATPAICQRPRVWFQGEALYWWTKDSPVSVPIVTTLNSGGQATSPPLIGNENIDQQGRGGGRFTIGFTLDDAQQWALEMNYLFLATSSVTQTVSSDGSPGSPTLIFPYYDPTLPGESYTFISLPGAFSGTASLRMREYLQGGEINLAYTAQKTSNTRLDVIGGFRWLNLQERMTLFTDSPNLAGDDAFQTYDDFQTSNNFYGGQLGLRGTYDDPRFYLNATAKVALGTTIERVYAYGSTYIAGTGGAYDFSGGYLAQPTNIGTQSRSRFTVVPEVDLNCGIKLTPWMNFIVGYSFLYASSVARPGQQVDRVINPTQAPSLSGNFPNLTGPARPTLAVNDTSYWAQGVNFGLEFKF